MFEYDKEQIARILTLEEFEFNEFNLNQIMHVPMHQYRISSNDKPFLLIENLQVCIGLYAYSKNFGFSAHLNPVVVRGDEFICDKNKNIVYSKRIEDLYKAIIDNGVNNVNIGISIGFNPVTETYCALDMLNKEIDDLIIKLEKQGIIANKLDIIYNHVFIIDSINEKIIIPNVKLKSRWYFYSSNYRYSFRQKDIENISFLYYT